MLPGNSDVSGKRFGTGLFPKKVRPGIWKSGNDPAYANHTTMLHLQTSLEDGNGCNGTVIEEDLRSVGCAVTAILIPALVDHAGPVVDGFLPITTIVVGLACIQSLLCSLKAALGRETLIASGQDQGVPRHRTPRPRRTKKKPPHRPPPKPPPVKTLNRKPAPGSPSRLRPAHGGDGRLPLIFWSPYSVCVIPNRKKRYAGKQQCRTELDPSHLHLTTSGSEQGRTEQR